MTQALLEADEAGTRDAGFVPRPLQKAIAEANARFKVAVIHRRYGKTVLAVNWLIEGAEAVPNSWNYYVSPFKSQTKANTWHYFKMYTAHLDVKYNNLELTVTFPNGAVVALLGASEGWYQAHRGRSAQRIVMDEISQTNPDAWRSVFRPMLSDTKGDALFIGTPQGEDYLWELYRNGLDEKLPQWRSWLADVYSTGVIDDDEIATLRTEMDEGDFAREYLCRFDVPPKGSYFGKALEKAELDSNVIALPKRDVNTSWHFDKADVCTVIWWQEQDGRHVALDTWRDQITDVDEIADQINAKGYQYGRHYGPVSATDTLPRSRVRDLRRAGVRLTLPIDSWPVIEGIYASKNWLRSTSIAEGCPVLTSALRMYHAEFDEKLKVLKDKPVFDWTHDYASAFAAYAMQHRDRSNWNKPVGVRTAFNHAA